MTNFFVTYTMPDKASRDGYLREIKEKKIDVLSLEEDGCHKYAYYYPVDTDDTLFLWEVWETKEHQKIHCQTPHFDELSKLKIKYNVGVEIQIEEY